VFRICSLVGPLYGTTILHAVSDQQETNNSCSSMHGRMQESREGSGPDGERGARVYDGVWGRPTAGSRGRAAHGRSPAPEAKSFKAFERPLEVAKLPFPYSYITVLQVLMGVQYYRGPAQRGGRSRPW